MADLDDFFAPHGRAARAGNRQPGVLAVDLWGQEWFEDSPYESGNPSARSRRLIRIENKIGENKELLCKIIDMIEDFTEECCDKHPRPIPTGQLTH